MFEQHGRYPESVDLIEFVPAHDPVGAAIEELQELQFAYQNTQKNSGGPPLKSAIPVG